MGIGDGVNTYSDSTLENMKKSELISTIRCLERNCKAYSERLENQEKLLEEKECDVEITGINSAIGCSIGTCDCGQQVRSYQKYCDECGRRLFWNEL